jgi:hypothetical protein
MNRKNRELFSDLVIEPTGPDGLPLANQFNHDLIDVCEWRGRGKATTVVVAFSMLASACATQGVIAPISNSEPRVSQSSPTPTEKSRPLPTSTPTPHRVILPSATARVESKATLTPTEEVDVNAEIVQKVDDFLNGRGNFTEKKISELLYRSMGGEQKQGGVINQLGMYSITEDHNIAIEQAILLDGVVSGGYGYLILGTQDKQKNRFVHISARPISSFDEGFKFALLLKSAPEFDGKSDESGSVFVDSADSFQQFIKDFNGKGVLSLISLGDNYDLKKYSVDVQNAIKLSRSNYGAGSCLVGMQYVISTEFKKDFSKVGSCKKGTEGGIFTAAHPLSVDILEGMSFDIEKMTLIKGFWVKEIPNRQSYTKFGN